MVCCKFLHVNDCADPPMTSKGQKLLLTLSVNGKYILGVYQGKFSAFDLLLKHREKNPNGKWSKIRTPKHIHWAVDVLIKLSLDKKTTKQFLDFLINYWNNHAKPLTSPQERDQFLSNKVLLRDAGIEAKQYAKLAKKGQYNVKFLILMAKLLMVQEKTNRPNAYMFKKLLDALKDGNDIFQIVSIATYR